MSTPVAGPPGASSRREFGTVLLLVLAAALLLLVSTAGAWVTGTRVQPEPLPSTPVEVGGGTAAPQVRALGLLVLAAVPALLAVRRAGRLLLGVLLVLAGAAAGAVAVQVLGDPDALVEFDVDDVATTWRPYAAVAGAVLTALAGALTTARGRRWAGLSRRYEAPAAREAAAPAASGGPAEGPVEGAALWEALDRGEDPTRG